MTIATTVTLVAGICLLVLGRKLFWLVGAAIGFLIVMTIARRFFADSNETMALVVGVGAGLLGALAAVFLQKVAVWVAGFLAGGFLIMNLIERFGFDTAPYPWVAFVVGGIIGALLVHFLFEWALILVSSLTGSFLIAHASGLGGVASFFLVILLFIVGVVIQGRLKRGWRPTKKIETSGEKKE